MYLHLQFMKSYRPFPSEDLLDTLNMQEPVADQEIGRESKVVIFPTLVNFLNFYKKNHKDFLFLTPPPQPSFWIRYWGTNAFSPFRPCSSTQS